MKKFNFKTLLILALVLVLVLSLVACNKDKGGDTEEEDIDPTAIKSEQFFNDLWTASNSIGSAKINDTDDIGVSADLAVKVKVQNKKKEVFKEIDLGIALQIVYDRTGENTALKAKLYDAKDGSNWFTVYFYMNDPENLYIDFDGQKVKFGLEFGWNDDLEGYLYDFMNQPLIGDDLSIEKILQDISKTTGSAFDLNGLVNAVLNIVKGAANLDLAKLITDNKGLLEDTLGIKGILKDDGSVDLKAIFNSKIIKGFLSGSKCVVAEDGSKQYSTTIKLSSTISGAVSGLLKDLGIGDLVNGLAVDLNFGVDKGGAMDGFKLAANLPGLTVTDANLKQSVYPVVELAINNLEFKPLTADATTAKTYFGMADGYSDQVSLDASIQLAAKGLTLKADQINHWTKAAKTCVFNDTFTLNIKGNGNVGKDKAFYLYLDITNTAGKEAVQAIWDGKTVKVLLDNTVKGCVDEEGNDVPFVEEIVNCFGGWIYSLLPDAKEGNYKEKFIEALLTPVAVPGTDPVEYEYIYNGAEKVAATIDIDLYKLVGWAAAQIGNVLNGGATSEAEAYPFTMVSFKTIVTDVVTAITTGNDSLEIALPKTLGALVSSWFKLGSAPASIGTWYPRMLGYNQNWIDRGIELNLFEAGTAYQSVDKANLEKLWNVVLAGSQAVLTDDTDDDAAAYEAYVKVFGEGNEADAVEEKVYWKAINDLNLLYGNKILEFKGCESNTWYEIAFEKLASASVKIDLNQGAKIEVKASISKDTNAAITIKLNASTTIKAAELKEKYDELLVDVKDSKENPISTIEFDAVKIPDVDLAE